MLTRRMWTCKLLRDLSTFRDVWESLFLRLSTELPVPPVLDRPLSMYSGADLECLLIRRISSELRWAYTENPPHDLRFKHGYLSEEDHMLYLDGGRDCRTIVDLELLYWGPMWNMAADMPERSTGSPLTFHLCLTPSLSDLSPENAQPEGVDGIHIFHLTVQGARGEAKLVSQKIKHLRDSRSITEVYHVTLRGDYLVRCLELEDEDAFRFEVYNWVLSNDSVHYTAYIDGVHAETQDSDVLLMPDGKVVVFSTTNVSIYDVSNLQPIPFGAAEVPILQPYWTSTDLNFSDQLFFSKSCRNSYASRATAVLDTAVFGLTIPHNIRVKPSYERLSNTVPEAGFACIGISKMYVYKEERGRGVIHTAGLLWQQDEIYKSLLHLPPEQWLHRRYELSYQWEDVPFFDESSNRIFSFAENSWIMIDFGNVYPKY
ncbi:hypothetical protein BDN70DRAFT_992283 [Pholiota conissans]|uniref:Uncharacterized protein n=1 Tax=Pholiota conissans TaxID=109636 RepID=A0A9P5Z644_9AGAR|nr:hypothetical protein BDN70DRAFT_992283 [Pholiota conissans]